MPEGSRRFPQLMVFVLKVLEMRREGVESDSVRQIQAAGAKSLREIAAALAERGVSTARGGQWSANLLRRRLGEAS